MHFAESRDDHLAVRYINRASDGAVMEDYFDRKYLGELALPLGGSCPASSGDELIVKDGTVCKRYVDAQQKSITSDVDMVLMTFGGKHFRRLAQQCFVTGFVEPNDCKETLAEAHEYATNQLKADLVNILLDIASRMKPGGILLLSTYPHLIADVEYIIGNTEDDKFDARTAVRDLAMLIDQKQQGAIGEANSIAVSNGGSTFARYFVGTKSVFAGHEPKPGTSEDAEKLWINDSSAYFSEWYHPNAIGHRKWGEAIADAFAGKIDTGSWGGSTDTGANNVDLVFVIDSTGSMGGLIAGVKNAMSELTTLISETSDTFRIAIVDYKDFGDAYVSKLNVDFTNDLGLIQAGINGLFASGGGDTPEAVLSGLNTALNLGYRPGVTKLIIVMGDAPPKIGADGKEPVSGLTVDYIVEKSNALDPVQVMAVNTGSLTSGTAMNTITAGTGGSIISTGVSGVVPAIKNILENVSQQPFAWFGEKIVAKVGEAMLFDASGSFDPFGLPLTLFEWDFNGDKVFDETAQEPTTVYTYENPFDGYATLRVTSAAGVGVATAHVIANVEGSVSQLGPEYCEIDVVSGLPILEDDDGNQLYCLTDSSMWPTENKPGVIVILKDDTRSMISNCLEAFNNLPGTVIFQPCDVRNAMRIVERQVEIGDYSAACSSLDELIDAMGNSGAACVEMCRTLRPTPAPTSQPTTQSPTNQPTTSKASKSTIKPTKQKSTRKPAATAKPTITKKPSKK